MPSGKPGHAPVREAVFWSDKMNEYLIDSLLHQEAIGNRGEGRFFSVAYDNIINGIGDRFGVAVDRSNIKNRLKYIKESFNECKNLLGEDSRIKWSAVSKRFNAEPHVWRELIERKPEAKKWMTKTIDHYDRLTELFGKDREKRPPVDNFKSVPKKKARKELTQEHKSTPSNGSDFTVASGSDTTVNGSEAPNEAVIKNIVSGELDLSEACRTESGIIAIPVCANAFGKGLPYAPENWPCPGDEWYWRVGNRTNSGGYWADRYLTPPSRFRVATGKKTSFASRLQVEEFIRREFPSIDPSTFFSMFIWKIPAKGQGLKKGTQQLRLLEPEPEPVVTVPAGPCKARNNLCNLEREGFIESSPAQDCNICCAMPGFCRQCCCILCRKTVDYSFGGYSYIKCEAVVQENYICGHIAHLDCALRCYMAGTVGGKIGLDVQYICRICDNRTDLMMHVEKLMETCQSLESRDEIEPILNLGLCLLRGSSQTKANNMENLMASAMAKLTCGVEIAEIWKTGNDKGRATSNAGESSSLANGVTILGAQQVPDEAVHQGHLDPIDSFVDNALQFPEEAVRQGHLDPLELETAAENLPAYITGDHKAMSAKFENDIGLALQELKKSQEAEFRLAEEKLYSQKDCILNVYRQLESERAELADLGASSHNYNYHTMLSNVLNHVGQAKREEEKFKAMLKVADGFGKTPKSVTQELFGLSAATDSKSN